MSSHSLRAAIAVGGILAVAWSVRYTIQSAEAEKNREPASIEVSTEKMAVLRPDMSKHGVHTEKVRGPLSSSIAVIGSAASQSGDAFMLEATVTSSKMILNARFQWFLPAGVELINGSLDSQIPEVGPNEPFKTRLTLRQLQDGNQQIHFVVSGSQPGISFSSVSQYNSTEQGFLDRQKETLVHALRFTQAKAMRLFH